MEQTRVENCSFVKTILMLLVVLYHSSVFWTGTWFTKDPLIYSQSLSIVAKWLNSFHIYGFVLVSGYIYAFARKEQGKYRNRKAFLKDKARRLLIPFYFVVLTWVIPIQCIFFHYDLRTIFLNYILAENPNQLWFLWMLFVVFTVISYTIELIDRYWIIALLVSLIGYCTYVVLIGNIPNLFQILASLQCIPVFITGYYMRNNEIPRHYNCIIWIIMDIMLFCLYEYTPNEGIILEIVHYVIGFFLHLVGAIMAFIVLQHIADKISWKSKKGLRVLSSYTMPIYLFHQQFIYFSIAALNGKVKPGLNVLINFAISTTGSFLISKVLMKWQITRILIGEK